MFHVELVSLGGIFGPLKSDLGVFWPFWATDFIMGILKIWDNFWGPHVPILRLMFLEFLRNLWTFGINKKDGCFFFNLGPLQDPCGWYKPGRWEHLCICLCVCLRLFLCIYRRVVQTNHIWTAPSAVAHWYLHLNIEGCTYSWPEIPIVFVKIVAYEELL